MYQFKLPDIGEGVAEAEIVQWLVKVGDQVAENEVMAEVLTDKATVEISSPVSGVIHQIAWEVGDIVPVGSVFIEIEEVSGDSIAPKTEKSAMKAAEKQKAPAKPAVSLPAGEKHPPKLPQRPHIDAAQKTQHLIKPTAVPAVRAYAEEKGVDLTKVVGTGPNGRIMRCDVDDFISGKKPAQKSISPSIPQSEDPSDWVRKPLRGLRRAIAQRMRHSKDSAAHYTYVEEIDVTELEVIRSKYGKELSPLAFVTWAAVEALKKHLNIIQTIDDESQEIIEKKNLHMGVAVDTPDGLVVPVIRDADHCSVRELSEKIKDMADRARNRKLAPKELGGGVFTISSLGKWGGLMATPIINYPESAIMGVHKIRRLPRYVGNDILPRDIMNVSITLDHRIIDGAEAARFIQEVKSILESPSQMKIE